MTNTTVSPPQRPWRRHRAILPIALGGAALVATGAVAFGVTTAGELRSETTSAALSGVRVLSVDVDEGSIVVRRAAGADVEVRTTRNGNPGTEPLVTRTLKDGVLSIVADCPGFNLGCETELEIAVPAGTVVDTRAVDGTITAVGLATPRFSATAVAGVVTADFAQAPDEVRVSTVSGAAHVTLPPAEYQVSGAAVVGAVRLAVPSVPTSDRIVSVRTVTGAIEVGSR